MEIYEFTEVESGGDVAADESHFIAFSERFSFLSAYRCCEREGGKRSVPGKKS